MGWPALSMAESFDLEGRVHALLDPDRKRKSISRRLCTAMVLAAFALTVPLGLIHAQQPGTSISGTVFDVSGGVVPGAALRFKNTDGSNEEIATAGAAGGYKLQGIPAGRYSVKVTAKGFAAYQHDGIEIGTDTPASANFTLNLGEGTENVMITGKRPPHPNIAATEVPHRIKVGGNVQPFNLISKVNPAYPSDAQSEGVEGSVLVHAVISRDGSLLNITPMNNNVDRRLVNAAMAALPLWRYEPARLNGVPVETVTTIAVTFRLAD